MYPAATVINATRYMGVRPAGIAVCVSPEDAAACVTWARDTGVPFAVRSGGHSYAGFSTSDGLVIDVKGMRDRDASTRTAGTVDRRRRGEQRRRRRPRSPRTASTFRAGAVRPSGCPG